MITEENDALTAKLIDERKTQPERNPKQSDTMAKLIQH